jgi:predicted DCC family thiol-disulfide oxidoreductase YuxK
MRVTESAAWLSGDINSRIAAVMRWGMGIAVGLELISVLPHLLVLTREDVLRTPWVGPAVPLETVFAAGLAIVAAVSLLAFAIGAFTTLAGIILVASLGAIMAVDQQLYSNHLYLMVLMVGLLVTARPGGALSVDAWRHGEEASAPALPLLLIRFQVSIVYLFAALSKINPDFLSGTVLNSYLRADGLLAIPAGWRSFELMGALSILTIILELALAIGLWLPRWRRTVMFIGLALHFGMVFWVNLPLQLAAFSLVMWTSYLAFLAPERGSTKVVWDDSCDFCRGWVTWFRRLDWLRALEFVPISRLASSGLPVSIDDAAEAMHAVTPASTVSGFRAVIQVLSVLPVSFLWAILLELPPIRAVGDRAYRAVAMRRTCRVPVAAEGPP